MPAAAAAAAAVGGARGRPQNVRDWDENDVHAWASEQRHFKPSLLAFLKSQEIHGEALLDPDLLADDDFRQQVSFGQRVALKKAVEALRERPSVKRELFAPAGSSPSREPPRSGLLAIGERPAAAAATALDGPADEDKRDDSPDGVGASGGSQDEPMTEVQSDSASEEEEPGSIKSESESESESDSDTNDFVEEEQLGLDGSSSEEGSDDIFGSDGSPSAASGSEHDEWTPAASHRRSRPRATRAAAAPRKQLHRIPRGAARTAAAGRSAVAVATTPPPQQKENASRSSAANSKKRGSGTLDAFLPLHAARAKRLQQHAAAATATAAAAPFARLAGARAAAPAAVVPARAAAAAPAPAAAAAAPAAVNPASGSSSRSPSLVEKIKSRYEQIYADYADSLSGNAAPPSGANLANLSWMNIRYKVRAAVQVRVHN